MMMSEQVVCVRCGSIAELFDCDTKTEYGSLWLGYRCDTCSHEEYIKAGGN